MRRLIVFYAVLSLITSIHGSTSWSAEFPTRAFQDVSPHPSTSSHVPLTARKLPSGIAAYRKLLSPSDRVLWRQLTGGVPDEWEFRLSYTAWTLDSAYAMKQSINYAVGVDDADYLKQALFIAGLLTKKGGPTVNGRISDGVLTVGEYEFQMDGDALLSWREIGLWTSFESFPNPIPIPRFILDAFRTQA